MSVKFHLIDSAAVIERQTESTFECEGNGPALAVAQIMAV
jgi:hypothetical protein